MQPVGHGEDDPVGHVLPSSSVSDRYSGTPNLSATSEAAGPGSTTAASCATALASISSMCRRPMRPAPATAIRTRLLTGQLPCWDS